MPTERLGLVVYRYSYGRVEALGSAASHYKDERLAEVLDTAVSHYKDEKLAEVLDIAVSH
jgi:hypothetical protein